MGRWKLMLVDLFVIVGVGYVVWCMVEVLCVCDVVVCIVMIGVECELLYDWLVLLKDVLLMDGGE